MVEVRSLRRRLSNISLLATRNAAIVGIPNKHTPFSSSHHGTNSRCGKGGNLEGFGAKCTQEQLGSRFPAAKYGNKVPG
jgi:hypothetical protein